MSATTKTNRLEIRLTKDQKEEIERAAAISGRSVSDFTVSVLVKEAEEVIRFERDLAMSHEAWESFSAIVDRPARSIDGLADLFKRSSVFQD